MADDLLVAGDALVDFLPEGDGGLDETDRFAPRPGGSGANVAMGLGALGRPALLFTNLATDPFGDALAAALDDHGVPDDLVHRDADARTTLALVSHGPGGEPTFAFYRDRGADTRLPVGGVPDETLAAVDVVHLTGVTLSVEPSRTATLDLAARARDHGCTVALDPNVRPSMWPSDRTMATVLRGALAAVDVVLSSVEDLRAMGIEGDDPTALARAVCDHGPHTTLLTLGADGALTYGTGAGPWAGHHRHGGYEVDPVDTTGAGDAFDAATVASLSAGVAAPERVLAVANAAGAVATTRRGAVTALDGPERVRELAGEVPW